MRQGYVPEKGDIVWLDFAPQAGREQAGRRPALVLTAQTYNAKSGLAVFCPITNQAKGYPFEVTLPEESRIRGVMLTDHLKSLDWKQRNAERADGVSAQTLRAVQERITVLLGLD